MRLRWHAGGVILISATMLLDELRRRPEMYLGEPRLDRLRVFLGGYSCGVGAERGRLVQLHVATPEFDTWLRDELERRGILNEGRRAAIGPVLWDTWVEAVTGLGSDDAYACVLEGMIAYDAERSGG